MEVGDDGDFSKPVKEDTESPPNVETTEPVEDADMRTPEDLLLPLDKVSSIMRQALPFNAKTSEEARRAMQEFTTEYISHVTAEANNLCSDEKRKTMKPEDLIIANGKLGFLSFVQPLCNFLQSHRKLKGIRDDGGSISGEQPWSGCHGGAGVIEEAAVPPGIEPVRGSDRRIKMGGCFSREEATKAPKTYPVSVEDLLLSNRKNAIQRCIRPLTDEIERRREERRAVRPEDVMVSNR